MNSTLSNNILLKYLVIVIIAFFIYFGYESILGNNKDPLAFFYTAHLGFDALLLAGVMTRAFVALFDTSKTSHEANVKSKSRLTPDLHY